LKDQADFLALGPRGDGQGKTGPTEFLHEFFRAGKGHHTPCHDFLEGLFFGPKQPRERVGIQRASGVPENGAEGVPVVEADVAGHIDIVRMSQP
jgi:hypothetical protein